MAASEGFHHIFQNLVEMPMPPTAFPALEPATTPLPPPAEPTWEDRAQQTEAEPGEVLSTSQVSTFMDCPARWYFKYVWNLPDPRSAALAVGSAFHAALKANFQHKLEHGSDLPLGEAIAAYHLSWHEQQETAVFHETEDPAELGRQGEALVKTYMVQAAPQIRPVLLEQRVSGVIGGVRTQGYVDLLDVNGVIIDSKSASKTPRGISANYALQLTTYSMLLPGHTGECRLDTVTKTKTVKFIPQMFQVGRAERRYASNIYPMVQDSIRQGVYLPKRNSHLCSRRHCSFWRQCIKEFGGNVDE